MQKRTFLAIAFLLAVLTTGQAKKKSIVWEEPTTEYGTSYGDGYFNTTLDVTKVELKKDETVVYITVKLRSDYPDFRFQFVGDTYLKAGEQRYALVSADGIELDTYVQTTVNVHSKSKASSLWRNDGSNCSRRIGATSRATGLLPF